MDEIDKTNLTEQTKIRLNKITEIENHFHEEINQRKSCCTKLSKYVATFDYLDKILIVFKRNNWWSIYHFVYKCCGSPIWNSKCKFYFDFFSKYRNNKRITKHNKKQIEKA